MIGVLIVTHGRLGEALLESASMLVGDTDQVRAVGFLPGQGVEDLDTAVRAALADLDDGDGILAMVDIPGGSPARVVGALTVERRDLELVAGANLGMLVETLMARRDAALPSLAGLALQSGRDSIRDLASAIRAETAMGGEAASN